VHGLNLKRPQFRKKRQGLFALLLDQDGTMWGNTAIRINKLFPPAGRFEVGGAGLCNLGNNSSRIRKIFGATVFVGMEHIFPFGFMILTFFPSMAYKWLNS
jgi:hypothetical protein